MNEIGLYIHIPFCRQKCGYCSFTSFPITSSLEISAYIQTLKKEIKHYQALSKIIKTIYIGGGTPSAIPSRHINTILDYCYSRLSIKPNAEITLEINPGSIDEMKLKDYTKAGINRISIGAQSFNDKHLTFLGRPHTANDIFKIFSLCRKHHISNISLDLIFAYKGQRLKDWIDDLRHAVLLAPEHIALYDLSVEHFSKFYKKNKQESWWKVSEAQEIKMYQTACSILKKNNYQHYEISNFALPYRKSKHNVIYWDNSEYLGLGVGAISYIDNIRYGNTKNIKKYTAGWNCQRPVYTNKEKLSNQKRLKETLLLNLRNIDQGACLKHIEKRYNTSFLPAFYNQLDTLKKDKLIRQHKDCLTLTSKGILLFDYIARALL